MPKSYSVGPNREFNYPADSTTVRMIQAAGGRSKLTEEQTSVARFKTVVAGEDCSDMPADVLALYLERGWIIENNT